MPKFGEVRGKIYELTLEDKNPFGDTQVTIYEGQEVVALHQMSLQGNAEIFLYPEQIVALRSIVIDSVTLSQAEVPDDDLVDDLHSAAVGHTLAVHTGSGNIAEFAKARDDAWNRLLARMTALRLSTPTEGEG